MPLLRFSVVVFIIAGRRRQEQRGCLTSLWTAPTVSGFQPLGVFVSLVGLGFVILE